MLSGVRKAIEVTILSTLLSAGNGVWAEQARVPPNRTSTTDIIKLLGKVDNQLDNTKDPTERRHLYNSWYRKMVLLYRAADLEQNQRLMDIARWATKGTRYDIAEQEKWFSDYNSR